MAFNINAQIILQAPKNIKAITSSIQSQLQGVTINIGANVPKALQQQLNVLNTTLRQLSQSNQKAGSSGKQAAGGLKVMGQAAQTAGGAMNMLGKETALTFKRFAAAGLVTATFFRMTQAISEAIPKALEFQREMVRLEQITGKTAKQLNTVSKAIRNLSTSLGVDANELANVAKLFAQTGQSIKEVQASLLAVARSSLAPTFGEMAQTAEGLIAALNQFNIKASESEAVLGSLNRVSKKFAVESSDLIAAIRRAGGVFAIAAGDIKKPIQALQEFTAIFTAVRSTTRESAETVATGLRTIFTRLQRRGTIDALKALGINLTDVDGKFIGLFQSFRILSTELDKIIQKGDAITLSGITEELGGMRQVGKLIPAIQEFKKAEQALLEAKKGAQEGLGGDVAKGLTPLIKQFELVRERFNEFIRVIADSSTFSAFAKTALGIANAFLSLGEAITPILPALTALAAIKISKSLGGFASGFLGSFGSGGGMKAAGQTAGGAATGKGAANTASSTQAMGNLVGALGTTNTALKTSNTHLGNLNTTLGSLKGMITPLKTALSNLTRAFSISGPTSHGTPGMRAPSSAAGGGGGGPQAINFGPLQSALMTHTTALASNTTNLASVNTSLSALKGPLGSIKGSLTTVKTALNNLKGALQKGSSTKLAGAMGNVAKALTTNTTRLGTNTAKLGVVNTRLGTNTKALGGNTTRLGTNNKALGTNTAKLGTNTAKLGTNTTKLGTVTKALGTNTTKLGTHATKLRANTTKLGTVNTRLGTLAKALAKNRGLATNNTRLANNTKSLGNNTRRLGTNNKVLGTNTAKLGTVHTKLGTVHTRLGNNTKALGTNTAKLGTVHTRLGTNTTALGTNTAKLGAMATALSALKVVIGPTNTALVNLTLAINSLKTVMMTRGGGGAMGNVRGRGTGMSAPRRFATGGLVPGSGNRDTVPAMLTPGEFVVRKSAVNSVGTGALGQINGYQAGGVVKRTRSHYGNAAATGKIIVDPRKIGVVSVSPPVGTDPYQKVEGTGKITNPVAIKRLQQSGKGKKVAVSTGSLSGLEANSFLGGSLNSQAKALGIPTAGVAKGALAKAVSAMTGVPRTQVKGKVKNGKQLMKDGDALQRGGESERILKENYNKNLKSRTYSGAERGRGKGGKALKGPMFRKKALQKGGFAATGARTVKAMFGGSISTFTPGFNEQKVDGDPFEEKIHIILEKQVKEAITQSAKELGSNYLLSPGIQLQEAAVVAKSISTLLSKGSGAMDTLGGFILEGMVGALTGAPVAGSGATFDFPTLSAKIRQNMHQLFTPNAPEGAKPFLAMQKLDAKKKHRPDFGNVKNKDGIGRKILNDVNLGEFRGVTFAPMAKGGTAQGTDTVPAMLTPGEYVVNKGAAQAFGYGNLKNINRYAAGGVVKKGRGNYGVPVSGGNVAWGQAEAKKLKASMGKLAGASLNAFFGLQSLISGFEELNSETGSTTMAVVNLGFGISMMTPAVFAAGEAIAALTAWVTKVGGALAAFSIAWTKMVTFVKGAGPMMQGAMIAGVGLMLGYLANMIADATLGKKVSVGKTGSIAGRTGVSAIDSASADAVGGALSGAGVGGGVGYILGTGVGTMMGGPGGAMLGGAIGGSLGATAGAIGGYRSAREEGLIDQTNFLAMEKLIVSNGKLVDVQEALEKSTLLTSGEMVILSNATNNLAKNIVSSGLGIAGITQPETGMNADATSQEMIVSQGLQESRTWASEIHKIMLESWTGNSELGPEDVEEYMTRTPSDTTGFPDRVEFDDAFIIAEIKGIATAAGKIFSEIDLETLAKQTQNSIDLTFKSLEEAVKHVGTSDLAKLPNDLKGAMDAMDALGISTDAFKNAIESAINISMVNKAAQLSKGGADDKATSVAFAILQKKAGEMGTTVSRLAETMDPAAFAEFTEEAGIMGPALKNGAQNVRLLAIEERKRLEETIPKQQIMMMKLAQAEQLANSAMNTFVSSFTRFSGAVTKGAQVFTNFADSFGSFADNLGGPQFDVRAQVNPFEDIDNSSTKELSNAVDRILSFAPVGSAGSGFEGIKETVAVQKALPEVLREVTIEALEAPKAQTPAELGTMLEGKIKAAVTGQGLDADKIPPVVLEGLRASVQNLIGNRQDSAGTSEEELRRLFESEDFAKIMEEFGDATAPVLEALSEMHDAVNEVGTAQINLLSIQTDFIHKEIDARLQSIDVINKTSDALNKFRPGGGPKDTVARAEARLLQRQQGILGAPGSAGAASATIDVNQQQATVARLRERNREIRQNMANAGGPVIGADVSTTGAAGTFSASTIESEQAALLENSQQLTAHEKALQNLINSTDMLDATMAELSDIEKSRMDARQIAQFEAKRMSRVLNETDPVKRAKLMQEQYAGDQAFNKLQAGGALSPQDIAALIDGGLERRLAIGVASGDITEEQAEGRRAQFNNFLSETALPGMNQMLGGPFNGPAMEQLQNATALGGTAQGTTTKEKDLIIKAEEEAKKKRDAIAADFASKQSGFNLALKNAADQLGDFTKAVETAATKVNDANKEMQARLDEARALREGAQDTTSPVITDADAIALRTEAEAEGQVERRRNRDISQVEQDEVMNAKTKEIRLINKAREAKETLDAVWYFDAEEKAASDKANAELAQFQSDNAELLDPNDPNYRGDVPIRVGPESAEAMGQDTVVRKKLAEMVTAGTITGSQSMAAGDNLTGEDLVKQVQRLMQSIKMVDELMADNKLSGTKEVAETDAAGNVVRDAAGAIVMKTVDLTKKDFIDQVIAGTFSATTPGVGGAPGVTNDALKPLEAMSNAMLTPGSIYVHDVYVEKLLMEIVKLLGGSEEHLKRAKVAAEKELAGLKSPTGRQGTVTGNLQEQAAAMKSAAGMPKTSPEMQATVDNLVEQLDSGTLQEARDSGSSSLRGTPAQKAEAKAIAEQMGAGGGGLGTTMGLAQVAAGGDFQDTLTTMGGAGAMGGPSLIPEDDEEGAAARAITGNAPRTPPARSAFDTNVAGTGASKVKDETKVPEPEADNKMMKELNRRADEEIIRNQVIMDNRKKSGEFDSGASSPLDTTYQDARNKIREENRMPQEDFAKFAVGGKSVEEGLAYGRALKAANEGAVTDELIDEKRKSGDITAEQWAQAQAEKKGKTIEEQDAIDRRFVTDDEVRSRGMEWLNSDQRVDKVTGEALSSNMIQEGASKMQQDMSNMQTSRDLIDKDPDLSDEEKFRARLQLDANRGTIGEKETGLSQKQKTDALEARTANVLRKRTQESVTTFSGGAEAIKTQATEDRMKEIGLEDGGSTLNDFMPGLGDAVQEGRTDFGRAGETGVLGMKSATSRATSAHDQTRDLESLQNQREFGKGMSDDDLTFDVLGLGDKGLLGSKNKGDIGPKQKALALLQANEAEKMKRQNALYAQFTASKEAREAAIADGTFDPDNEQNTFGKSDEEDRAVFDRESAKIEESKFYGSEFMTPDQIAKHKGDQIASARDTRAKQGRGFGGTGTEDSVVPGAATSGPTSTREKVAEYLRGKQEEENKHVTNFKSNITAESLTPEQISGAIQQKQQDAGHAAAKRREMEEEAKKAAAQKAAEEKTAAAAAAAAGGAGGKPAGVSDEQWAITSDLRKPGAGGKPHRGQSDPSVRNIGLEAPIPRTGWHPDNPNAMAATQPLGIERNPGAGGVPGAQGAMGAAGGGEGGVDIRTLVDAINSLNQVTVNVLVAPINVTLNTGGLADQLRNVIGAEALKALKGDVMNNAIDARIREFVESTPAG